MENGSLVNYLIKEHKKMDVTEKLIVAYGISCGMEYLHSLEIIHRDLKGDNVLLDNQLRPYITDFGTSVKFSKKEMKIKL